jgi:pSer/pThr/pTyr-binding forkhead associated (FHA) protein
MVRLKLEGSNDELELKDKAEYILGRLDEPSKSYPDIDLDPYGGQDAGVSRRHAKIILLGSGLNYIMDLSSTNGTFINGEPSEPLRHTLLKDGDRIDLGELKLAFIEHSANRE